MNSSNTERAQPSFVVRGEWAPVISAMTPEDAGTLLRAMYAHAGHGEMPEMPDGLALTWTLVSSTMDSDLAKWHRTCDARRAAGAKGGAAKAANRRAQERQDGENVAAIASAASMSYLAEDFKKAGLNAVAVSGFCDFYRAFPRRVGAREAVKAYGKALKALVRGGMDETAAIAAIQAGAVRYAEEKAESEPRFIAHPASWLNAGRWADEKPVPNRRIASRGGSLAAIARLAGLCGDEEDGVIEASAIEEARHD